MLRVFENTVLGKIFGPKCDDVIREWRRLHYEKLYELCFSPNMRMIKRRRWTGHVSCMGKMIDAFGAET